jgi:hypothetical protein
VKFAGVFFRPENERKNGPQKVLTKMMTCQHTRRVKPAKHERNSHAIFSGRARAGKFPGTLVQRRRAGIFAPAGAIFHGCGELQCCLSFRLCTVDVLNYAPASSIYLAALVALLFSQ